MSTVSCLAPTSFHPLSHSDYHDWLRHQRVLRQIVPAELWRGCMGLALQVTHPVSGMARGKHFFVPDRDVRWISLVDIPRYYFNQLPSRAIHWASVHGTNVRFGMPTIGGQPLEAFDFRKPLSDFTHQNGRFVDGTKNQPTRNHLTPVLNAINWAMTSTAFSFRAFWRARRDQFFKIRGEECVPTRHLLYGAKAYDSIASPRSWMPRAYLGFKPSRRDWIWSACSGLENRSHHFATDLRLRLCADVGDCLPIRAPFSGVYVGAVRSHFHGLPTVDLVFERAHREQQVVRAMRDARIHVLPSQMVAESDIVAHDLSQVPAGWQNRTFTEQWKQLAEVWGSRFGIRMRLWFERQFVTLQNDLIHAPSDIAALAAKDHAVATALHWDLAPAMEYYTDAAGAFVFPTMQLRNWWEFMGILPGEVLFDFTPRDIRFVPYLAKQTRGKVHGKNQSAKREAAHACLAR